MRHMAFGNRIVTLLLTGLYLYKSPNLNKVGYFHFICKVEILLSHTRKIRQVYKVLCTVCIVGVHYIVIILLKLKTSYFCLEVEKGHPHNVLCCDEKRSLVFDIPLVDFPNNKESHSVFSVRGKNIVSK